MSVFPDDIFAADPLAAVIEEKTIQLKEGERRNVSILFADLKGFTEMSEKLDPEFVQTTIDKIMSVFTQVIKNHGGYVDKYSGDEVMALFGAKVASEVDSERAIRAAIQMLSNLDRFNHYMNSQNEYSAIDKPLAIRIGINTGLVTTGKIGEGREGDFTVYGDAVNLASRLESNAPVNSIMVPQSIQEMLPDQFEYEDKGEIEVKGKKDPISVFCIKGIQAPKDVLKEKYSTSFVGRSSEQQLLESHYKTALNNIDLDDISIDIVALKAPGGIGKTRLIHEFIKSTLKDASKRSYLILGSTTDLTRQPYFIFISLFRYYFDISEIDSPKDAAKTLRSGYAELEKKLDGDDKKSLEDSKAIIDFLFGIPSDDSRLKEKGKELQSHLHIAIFQIIRLITIACNQSKIPMVFVLEDLHWIDDPSLEALKYLVSAFIESSGSKGISSLFIFNYRPIFEVPSEIANEKSFNEEDLTPLSDQNSTELILQAFSSDAVPEYEVKNILKVSGGNPFYIEEWIAYISSYQQKEGLTVEKILDKYPAPTSLNAIILSRVDALEAKEKALLQNASIMGLQFYSQILKKLDEILGSSATIDKSLKLFISKDLILDESGGKYSFKSAIARDVIYEAILKSNRKLLHLEVGNIIEEEFADNRDLFYYDLAGHFVEGEGYDKAVIYLEKSAKKAREFYDNKLTSEFYSKLLEIFKNSDYSGNVVQLEANKWKVESDEDKGKLESMLTFQYGLTDMLTILGDWDEAKKVAEETFPLATSHDNTLKISASALRLGDVYRLKGSLREGREWLTKGIAHCKTNSSGKDYLDIMSSLLIRLGSLDIDEGKLDDAESIFSELEEIIKDVDRPMDKTSLHHKKGVVSLRLGNMEKAYTEFEASNRLCETHNFKNQSIQALGNMAVVNNIQGKYQEAIDIFVKMMEVAEELGDRKSTAQIYGNIGLSHMFMKEYESAITHFNTQIAISSKMNDNYSLIVSNNNISYTYVLSGDYKKAVDHALKSISINEKVGIPESRAQACDNLGLAYIQLGEFKSAEKYYKEAIDIFNEVGNKRGIAEVEGGLGIIHMEQNNNEESIKYFTSALEEFETVKDQRHLAIYYLKRSQVYVKEENFQAVEDDILKSLEYSKSIHDKSLKFQGNIYKVINDIKLSKTLIIKVVTEINKLKDESLSDADQALYYYHLWHIGGEAEDKERAVKLYQKLDKQKPSYFYKKYLAELES